jgi:Holliday junction resolvase RusA-like endonuclease
LKIQIKPLSVNGAWNTYCTKCKQAKNVRRTKTDKYKAFTKELTLKLKPIKIDFKRDLSVHLTFGFSSTLSDIDNPLKCTLDVLQSKFGFDDKQIFELKVKKEIVKKGEEFIELKINEI